MGELVVRNDICQTTTTTTKMLESSHPDRVWPTELANKMARKIGSSVKESLSSSSHLEESAVTKLPCFQRKELVLGRILGSGGFSHVLEVNAIQLQKQDDNDKEDHRHKARKKELVDLARDRVKDKARVVVKHIRPKFLKDRSKFKTAGSGLVREGYYLASLQHHPNIVSLRGWTHGGPAAYATGCHYDSFFLLLERLDGTLTQRIKEWRKQLKRYKTLFVDKKFDLQDSLYYGRLQVARSIASALHYMHSKRIIHRDIKPSNIGFDIHGNVKLFDFGLAVELLPNDDDDDDNDADNNNNNKKEEKPLEMTGRVGTTKYMSPEVCLGRSYNDKADVYSLALVIWEMMALEKPYKSVCKAKHRSVVTEQRLRPPLQRDWPSGVQSLLECAWAEAPCERPTMRQIHDWLEQLVSRLQTLRSRKRNGSSAAGSGGGGAGRPWSPLLLRKTSLLVRNDSWNSLATADTTSTPQGGSSSFTLRSSVRRSN